MVINNEQFSEQKVYLIKPDKYEFLRDFAKNSGIPLNLLHSWMKTGKLGKEIQKFRNPIQSKRTGYSYALSPNQQKVAAQLKIDKDRRLDKIPEKPEGYEFIADFTKNLGISANLLRDWLRVGRLGGKAEKFRNPIQRSTGYSYALSPKQQKVAIQIRKNKDKWLTKMSEKPKEYEFLYEFAKNSGMLSGTVRSWLNSGKLGGKPERFLDPNLHSGWSYALSPNQQRAAIRLKTDMNEQLAKMTEKPEGYVFLYVFAKKSSISAKSLLDRLKFGGLGGEIYKFRNPNVRLGWSYALSPEQQAEALRMYTKSK